MSMKKPDIVALRGARDRLRAELVELDRLGEHLAALEVNSAIELLNLRLGEKTEPGEIEKLERRYFSN